MKKQFIAGIIAILPIINLSTIYPSENNTRKYENKTSFYADLELANEKAETAFVEAMDREKSSSLAQLFALSWAFRDLNINYLIESLETHCDENLWREFKGKKVDCNELIEMYENEINTKVFNPFPTKN